MKAANEKRENYASAEMDVVELTEKDVLTATGDIVLPDIPVPMMGEDGNV